MESQWLRDAIRLSLKASISSSLANDAKGPPEQRDPRLRKLAEGVLFTKTLVPTYNLVVLGFILLLSVDHWTKKAIRWRRIRTARLRSLKAEYADDGANPGRYANGNCSSGSSTMEGTASPPRKYLDEEVPLLHHVHSRRPFHLRRTIFASAKASLLYHPRPIPIVNKTLPSNGTSVAILVFIALNVFYIFFQINLSLFELFVFADRVGAVFVANLPLLYLLAAKNQPLKFLIGRSYESLNIFHRRLGELLCLEALVHSAGMTVVWWTLLRPGGLGFIQFLLVKVVWLGLGAFITYELLYFTSLGSFRQRWYGLFLGLHIVLQVAALIFVFFHHPTAAPYVGTALGIFLMDRLVYRFKSTSVGAYTKILEDEDTVRLSSTVFVQPPSRWETLFGKSIMCGWNATDHVFLTVPSLSSKHLIQAHPFLISSASPLPGDEEAHLELLIRAKDGFSRDLLNAARLHKHITIRLDGPYGSSHAREMLEEADLAIVVAGGSGVAVGFPLIHHLLDISGSIDTKIAPMSALLRQKIIMIWVIHEEDHLSWVGRQALANAENRGAEIIVPRATSEIGRPDLKGMIHEIVDEFASRIGTKIRVVASGPDSMGRSVRNTCAGLLRDGRDIDVAIEKLGW